MQHIINHAVLEAIIACGYATDKDRTSATLTGVKLNISGNVATIAATDGKILVEHVLLLPEQPYDEINEYIIPWSSCKETADAIKASEKRLRKLNGAKQHVTVTVSDSKKVLSFTEGGGTSWQTKVIDSNYPKYDSALNAEYHSDDCAPVAMNMKYVALLDKAMLLPAMNKAVMFYTQAVKGKPGPTIIRSAVKEHQSRALIMPINVDKLHLTDAYASLPIHVEDYADVEL